MKVQRLYKNSNIEAYGIIIFVYKAEELNNESSFDGIKSNGSLMRIFPLVLLLLPLENEDHYNTIFLIFKEESSLTHNN